MAISVEIVTARITPWAWAAQDEQPAEIVREAEQAVVFLWRFILMPLLFCFIGTNILFAELPVTTIQHACALIVSGCPPSPSLSTHIHTCGPPPVGKVAIQSHNYFQS